MVDRVESWAREAEAVGLQAVRDPTGRSVANAHNGTPSETMDLVNASLQECHSNGPCG